VWVSNFISLTEEGYKPFTHASKASVDDTVAILFVFTRSHSSVLDYTFVSSKTETTLLDIPLFSFDYTLVNNIEDGINQSRTGLSLDTPNVRDMRVFGKNDILPLNCAEIIVLWRESS
jgi:hypothetical protein